MNARQQAEYRDELARMRLADSGEAKKAARDPEKKRPKRAYRLRPVCSQFTPLDYLPPVTPPVTHAEAALVERLLEHICEESAVDRERHALGIARMILARSRRS